MKMYAYTKLDIRFEPKKKQTGIRNTSGRYYIWLGADFTEENYRYRFFFFVL